MSVHPGQLALFDRPTPVLRLVRSEDRPWPPDLKLCDPPERGWEKEDPPDDAA